MVVIVRETDSGSKKRAMQATYRTAHAGATTTQNEMLKWLSKVVMLAKSLCPVETGTLARTIRIVTQAPTGGFFEVVKNPLENKIGVTALITAGGWLVNPKTGFICDYAQAVHDGHLTRGGGYYAGVPFLTMAIDASEAEYQEMVKKIGDAHENAWRGD